MFLHADTDCRLCICWFVWSCWVAYIAHHVITRSKNTRMHFCQVAISNQPFLKNCASIPIQCFFERSSIARTLRMWQQSSQKIYSRLLSTAKPAGTDGPLGIMTSSDSKGLVNNMKNFQPSFDYMEICLWCIRVIIYWPTVFSNFSVYIKITTPSIRKSVSLKWMYVASS